MEKRVIFQHTVIRIKGKITLFSMKARYFRGISLKQSYRNRMLVNLQAPLDLS